MILTGNIEINGIILTATLDMTTWDKSRAYKTKNGKWRAYKTVNGKHKSYGTHDTQEAALKAARDEVKPSRRGQERYKAYKLTNGKYRAVRIIDGARRSFGVYETKDAALEAARTQTHVPRAPSLDAAGVYKRADNGMWRVILTIGGKRVPLGEYGTYGNAVLVRDAVARRSGLPVTVADYEMPLSLISNAVARSYITDRVDAATPASVAEYQRRVDELNIIY